jgi:hypothetical protein
LGASSPRFKRLESRRLDCGIDVLSGYLPFEPERHPDRGHTKDDLGLIGFGVSAILLFAVSYFTRKKILCHCEERQRRSNPRSRQIPSPKSKILNNMKEQSAASQWLKADSY